MISIKKITLYFYSCANLGDDLFVKTLAEYFRECRVQLIVNPKCIPGNLGPNVRVHPHSFTNLLFGKLRSVLGESGKIGQLLGRWNDRCFRRIAEHSDAYVYIGGSIFMEHVRQGSPRDFAVEQKPVFGLESKPREKGNTFVVGANLGPFYSERHCDAVREELLKYTHVCVRDWASYCLIRDLEHVQYAPDVLFQVPQPKTAPQGENVVMVLVDMARHTDDQTLVDAYYQLMADAVMEFSRREIPVKMVSFCQWEGDEAAIDRVLGMVPEASNVSRLCYHDDDAPILEALSGATYVIGSRFHSMILGISYGKPVFPVAYNCKTEHYLQDLGFEGRYADLQNMTTLTVEDLLYNYDRHIVTDCEAHKANAKLQFRALRQFLGLEDR